MEGDNPLMEGDMMLTFHDDSYLHFAHEEGDNLWMEVCMKWTFHDDSFHHSLHMVGDNLWMEVCRRWTFHDDDCFQGVEDSLWKEAGSHYLSDDVD